MPDQDLAHSIREMRKRTDRANEEMRTKGELSPETIELLNQPIPPREGTDAKGADADHVDKKFDLASKKPAARAFVAEQLGIDVRKVAVGIAGDAIAIRITTEERPAGTFPTEFDGVPLQVQWIGPVEVL
jgi:hypothetical protein